MRLHAHGQAPTARGCRLQTSTWPWRLKSEACVARREKTFSDASSVPVWATHSSRAAPPIIHSRTAVRRGAVKHSPDNKSVPPLSSVPLRPVPRARLFHSPTRNRSSTRRRRCTGPRPAPSVSSPKDAYQQGKGVFRFIVHLLIGFVYVSRVPTAVQSDEIGSPEIGAAANALAVVCPRQW